MFFNLILVTSASSKIVARENDSGIFCVGQDYWNREVDPRAAGWRIYLFETAPNDNLR